MTSRYIDPIWIVQLVESSKNDQELGKNIRTYISECKELYLNDEPFPKTIDIGNTPSDYVESLKRYGCDKE